VEIGNLTFTLRPSGETKILTMTVLRHAVEERVPFRELETIALFFAAQVRTWREERIETERHTLS
jgi:hypothetical protein